MSLNFNGSRIKGWADIPSEECDAIIWLTMAVDIGDITEKNWREFAYRLKVYQDLFGAYWTVNGKPERVTAEHVKKMIGLSTNVTNRSRSLWGKRMMDCALREAEQQMKRAEEKAEQAEAVK